MLGGVIHIPVWSAELEMELRGVCASLSCSVGAGVWTVVSMVKQQALSTEPSPALRRQVAEAGGSLWVWGQPGLQNKFQDSWGIERPCLKQLKTRNSWAVVAHAFYASTWEVEPGRSLWVVPELAPKLQRNLVSKNNNNNNKNKKPNNTKKAV